MNTVEMIYTGFLIAIIVISSPLLIAFFSKRRHH